MSDKPDRFSIKKRLHSFFFAFNGLKILVKEEHNARIHLAVLVAVIMAGFLLRISPVEWALVLLSIGIVLSMEIINSVVERLADLVSKERDEKIMKIKDLSAGAVLISAVVALLAGFIDILSKSGNCFH